MNYKYRHLYVDSAIDIDGSTYFKSKVDVQMYDSFNSSINYIFNYYSFRINMYGTAFVIGNVLYFTFNNVKYWTIISSFIEEEDYLHRIIHDLTLLGCTNFYYKYGHLD